MNDEFKEAIERIDAASQIFRSDIDRLIESGNKPVDKDSESSTPE